MGVRITAAGGGLGSGGGEFRWYGRPGGTLFNIEGGWSINVDGLRLNSYQTGGTALRIDGQTNGLNLRDVGLTHFRSRPMPEPLPMLDIRGSSHQSIHSQGLAVFGPENSIGININCPASELVQFDATRLYPKANAHRHAYITQASNVVFNGLLTDNGPFDDHGFVVDGGVTIRDWRSEDDQLIYFRNSGTGFSSGLHNVQARSPTGGDIIRWESGGPGPLTMDNVVIRAVGKGVGGSVLARVTPSTPVIANGVIWEGNARGRFRVENKGRGKHFSVFPADRLEWKRVD